MTLNYAHRGFTSAAPDNSLGAFQAALDLGADGIEFDVRVCASGEVVVFHDPGLKRMTGRAGQVKNLTLDELRDVRLRRDGQETNEPLPTFEQTLDLVGGRLLLNVEIKANGLPAEHRIEEKVIAALKRHGLFENTIISSFNPLIMRRLRKVDPNAKSGFLINKKLNVRNTEIFFARISGAHAIHIDQALLTKQLFQKIQRKGYLCLVWTVNEKQQMQKLIDWGVTGIISDRPDVLLNMTRDSRK